MTREFFRNYIVIALIAWFTAQICKVILVRITSKKFDFTRIVGSGGMPSSHSALVTSLATSIGITRGFLSCEFAISVVLALVVMYDAAGIRRAAGEQAKTLNKLLENWNRTNDQDEYDIETTLKELLGHTPFEVLIGAILGIVIAIILS